MERNIQRKEGAMKSKGRKEGRRVSKVEREEMEAR